jgi:hypothetical protein
MQLKIARSQEYRRRAHECRRLAQMASHEDLRVRYLDLARIYDLLAAQSDALQTLGETFAWK